jgi:hypothetical protein
MPGRAGGVAPGGRTANSGRGQRLARHFLALARSLKFEEMDVSADPLAEDFYVAMGAVRIAEVPSDAIPNRLIPRLRFSLLADRVTAHHLSDFAPLAHPGEENGNDTHDTSRCSDNTKSLHPAYRQRNVGPRKR